MHVVDVDQSGKFENTKHDTVVAFSNGIDFSVIIPATVKRDCITALGDTVGEPLTSGNRWEFGPSAPQTARSGLWPVGRPPATPVRG